MMINKSMTKVPVKHKLINVAKAGSLLLLSILTLSGQARVGGSAANFLGIGAGAAGLAQGSSQVARGADASAIYWNPGATAQLPGNMITLASTEWLVGTKISYGALVFKISHQDAIGISFFNLDFGEQEVTTIYEQNGTGEYWSASDMAISLNYSRLLTDRFSIGGTMKFLQQSIWHETASAVAADVGILFKTQLDGLNIGMSVANYGFDMQMDGPDLLREIDIDPDALGNNETLVAKMSTVAWPLPLFFRLGLSYERSLGVLGIVTAGIDAFVPSDNVESVNVGAEWRVMNILALRAGYKGLGDSNSREGLTLGGGLKLNRGVNGMSIDYSYQGFEDFDDVQTFGISLSF